MDAHSTNTPVVGVRPGAVYDPTISLLFPDDGDISDLPTVKMAAITVKLPKMNEKTRYKTDPEVLM